MESFVALLFMLIIIALVYWIINHPLAPYLGQPIRDIINAVIVVGTVILVLIWVLSLAGFISGDFFRFPRRLGP